MVDADLEVLHAQGRHGIRDNLYGFEVRGSAIRTHDVEIALCELAIPAALSVLASPDFRDMVALERQVELPDVLRHKAREGDGQVEPQRHVPAAVVLEPVYLLVRLPAALSQEYFGILQDRSVYRYESERAKNIFELSRKIASLDFGVRQEIPKAFQDSGLNNLTHIRSSRDFISSSS